ncbi:MAG: hypothetical protein RIQ46_1730 [Pseudomonadota bacterium]
MLVHHVDESCFDNAIDFYCFHSTVNKVCSQPQNIDNFFVNAITPGEIFGWQLTALLQFLERFESLGKATAIFSLFAQLAEELHHAGFQISEAIQKFATLISECGKLGVDNRHLGHGSDVWQQIIAPPLTALSFD